jgi:hypothetical protein
MGRLSWLRGVLRVNVVGAEATSGADTKALQHLPAQGGAMGSSLTGYPLRHCMQLHNRAEAAPNTTHQVCAHEAARVCEPLPLPAAAGASV